MKLKFSIKAIVVVFSIIISAMAFMNFFQTDKLPIIAIANWGPHASLQATIDGIQEQLHKVHNNIKIKIADVNFEPTLILQMLHNLKASKPKVIVTMGTPISQAAKNSIKEVPLIFANVTDPITAGLASQPGVSDQEDLKLFMTFAKKLMPNIKNIGLLYSTSEANDAALVQMMKQAAELYNIGVVAIPVEHARDIPLRINLLNNKVDLIYVGVSGTIQPSLPTIVANADRMNIPVFNVNKDAVLQNYVVGSFGVDYRKIGHQVADLIVRMLHGENVKDLKILYPEFSDFHGFISKQRAEKFGIKIPEDLKNITVVN